MKNKNPERVKQGKKNKRDGGIFERKVRLDLEEKGWVVSKWMNNVEFDGTIRENINGVDFKTDEVLHYKGKLILAKHKFCGIGRPMAIGTGFPDFVVFKLVEPCLGYDIIGVEAKSNGYLDKEEKEKCKWLLENNIFRKILIAKKVKVGKYNEIVYEDFWEKYK
jgi:hypothetical protein